MFVEHYMTAKVITVGPETSLWQAWDLIQTHRIRHLPVTQGRRLLGIITDRSLRHLLPSSLAPPEEREGFRDWGAQVKVGEVMTRDVATVSPRTPAAHAARLMVERRIECMPVLLNSALVGIITTADLLRALAGHGRSSTPSFEKQPPARRKPSKARGMARGRGKPA